MRESFLTTLHCPYSNAPLRVTHVASESQAGIRFGVATSEVAEFPIVDGILRLLVDEQRPVLVNLVKRGLNEEALLTAFDFPYREKGGAVANLLARVAYGTRRRVLIRVVESLKRRLFRVLTDPNLSFVEAVQRLPSRSWANWEIFRFSTEAFLPLFPLSRLVQPGAPILDLGSGAGQGAFLLARASPSSRLVCADCSFSALYLARKYFVPDALLVCLDGDYPLPFASKYFGTVLCADALHYIDSKASLTAEARRTLTRDGVILLPHLHNQLAPVQFGTSLTPGGYCNLFRDMPLRILSGKKIVEDFLRDGLFDLTAPTDIESLTGDIEGLSLIVSENPSVFQRYTDLWGKRFENFCYPVINPMYAVNGQGAEWDLRRRHPVLAYARHGGLGDLWLPEAARIKAPSLSTEELLTLKQSAPSHFMHLLRQFVLIDVPATYTGRTASQ